MRKYLLLFFFTYLHFTSAQWVQTNGPLAGAANDFLVKESPDSSFMFAVMHNDLYVSSNNGGSWARRSINAGTSLSYSKIYLKGNTLYLCTSKGLYQSNDNGMNWIFLSQLNSTMTCLAFLNSYIFTGTHDGIYRSIDLGVTWTKMWYPSGTTINDLLVIDNKLYAATSFNLIMSTNAGQSWQQQLEDTFGFRVLLYDGSNLFAGYSGGIKVSSDFGNTWRDLNQGFYLSANYMDVHGNDIYASGHDGLNISTDYGITWRKVVSGAPRMYTSAVFVNDNKVFAGTSSGIFFSTDKGVTWISANEGLINSSVNAFTRIDDKLFASAWSLYFTTDYGNNWQPADTAFRWYGLSPLISHGGNLYGGAAPNVSTDFGKTWTSLRIGPDDAYSHCLAFYAETLFVGTYANGYGLFRSTDYGLHWINSGLGNDPNINSISVVGDYILVTGSSGLNISSDGGRTWEPQNIGTYFYDAVGDGKIFIASTYGKIFVSTDAGETWDVKLFPGTIINDLVMNNNQVFADIDTGVILSNDYGTTWSPFSEGLNNVIIQSLFVDNNTLYAGTYNAGVWKRTISSVTSVVLTGQASLNFTLEQNYPNPFNPYTTITWSIPEAADVELTIYDILGKEVRTLIKEHKEAGTCKTELDAANLPSGVYFYTLISKGKKETRKLLLLK